VVAEDKGGGRNFLRKPRTSGTTTMVDKSMGKGDMQAGKDGECYLNW